MSTHSRIKSKSSTTKPQLFAIHDPPAVEAAEKKRAQAAARKAQHQKRAGSKKNSSLFPKETSSRTFFIPEQLQTDPPVLLSETTQAGLSSNGQGNPRIKTKPSIPLQKHNSKTEKTQLNGPTTSNINLGSTRPRHSQTAAKLSPFASQGVVKQTLNLRTRPKSATAARHQNPEPGTWHLGTECEDWNMLTLATDAQRWSHLPQQDTEKVDRPLKAVQTLSHRKPSVPGQVCYGTNNKGVSLPRRPMTASEGRENRPSVTAILDKQGQELERNDFGGWEASTQLTDERTNFDGRYRYPQRYAVGDVARVNEYRLNPPPNTKPTKAAWVHTSSSYNFTSGEGGTKAC